MSGSINASERFVAVHCDRTFLSLWGMANPVGKDGTKELCDYLVVCDPDIIILSVKDVHLAYEPNRITAERWHRKAIEASVKQIYGAERFLTGVSSVHDHSGRTLLLPPADRRQIHRLCVAFGSHGRVGLRMGDFGKGFIHVMDEVSFPILLRHLDTICDLTHYLGAKRTFIEAGRRAICPGEEHLLALYLSNSRSFPNGHDLIVVDNTLWPGFTGSEENRRRQGADRASYAWDKIIEYISKDLLADDLLYVQPSSEAERVLRVLARENRFYRRFLGENLTEVLLGGNVRARMVQSLSGVVYVFMAVERTMDFQHRIAELTARCLVARSRHPNAGTVVGIASERADDGEKGLSFGLCLIDKPEWTVEDEKEANWLSENLGYFWSPIISTRHVEEYPIGTMNRDSS